MADVTLYRGDSLDVLRTLPSEGVHCVVTSPPYMNLRSYLPDDHPDKAREIGTEPTIQQYVDRLVLVFREVRRVMRADATLWLNIGDSYNGSGGSGGDYGAGGIKDGQPRYPGHDDTLLKAKDLCMVPARVALALQADGWWLRSELVWAKGVSFCKSYAGSAMPESVEDRPSKTHEMVYLLTKAPKYYYDAEAVKESNTSPGQLAHNLRYARPYEAYDRRGGPDGTGQPGNENNRGIHARPGNPNGGRNLRSVWVINPTPYHGAHYATFPPKLAETCILAGTSARGCCPKCGAPYERVIEHELMEIRRSDRRERMGEQGRTQPSGTMVKPASSRTIGWRPTCDCDAGGPVPCVVLDPFVGSGTTAMVAVQLGRRCIGIDLDQRSIDQAWKRVEQAQPALIPAGI